MGEDLAAEAEPVVTEDPLVAQEVTVAHQVVKEGQAVATVVPLVECQVTVMPLARAEDMAVLVDPGDVDRDVAAVEAAQALLHQPKHQLQRVRVATVKQKQQSSC